MTYSGPDAETDIATDLAAIGEAVRRLKDRVRFLPQIATPLEEIDVKTKAALAALRGLTELAEDELERSDETARALALAAIVEVTAAAADLVPVLARHLSGEEDNDAVQALTRLLDSTQTSGQVVGAEVQALASEVESCRAELGGITSSVSFRLEDVERRITALRRVLKLTEPAAAAGDAEKPDPPEDA